MTGRQPHDLLFGQYDCASQPIKLTMPSALQGDAFKLI